MIRQHQFDKVELVKVDDARRSPTTSWSRWCANAEEVLQRLELPYRVVVRCAGDVGLQRGQELRPRGVAAGAGEVPRDLVVLELRGVPGAPARPQVPARRAAAEPEFCHTLNGSGLAVGRTLIAVLENYQEADGSVTIPKALRPYMDGLTRLTPALTRQAEAPSRRMINPLALIALVGLC